MIPELKSFRVRGEYLIGANVGLRVLLLHADAKSVVYDVDLNADCMDCFSLSQDGAFLASAFVYEDFQCIEIINLREEAIVSADSREAATILRVDRVHAIDLRIAPDGNTLVYLTRRRQPETYAVHVPTGQQRRIAETCAPSNGAWLSDRLLIPLREGRGSIQTSGWPLTVSPVALPSQHNVWRLIENPDARTIAMLDANAVVAHLRADNLETLWSRQIPGAGWIAYSGDGRFICVQEYTEKIEPASMLILDASSGQAVHRIHEPDRASYPLEGPRFLCDSGRFLNAETGQFEEGVSKPEFWIRIACPP